MRSHKQPGSRSHKEYKDVFKCNNIPHKIEDFKIVFERSGIAVDLEMIKKTLQILIYFIKIIDLEFFSVYIGLFIVGV
jgi:hypothetical protein